MAFIKDLYQDEIRDGWLVKSDIKRVWNKQLEIWQEVDRICRKHKITYWAAYGTLLGAARHKGFIPWDEDLDLCMMRPEFNRFSEIIKRELEGGIFEIERNIFSMIKISHSQTTLITRENIKEPEPKGILIDIFPLDITLDGTKESFFATNAINELLVTIYNYPALVKYVQEGGKTANDWSIIETLNDIKDYDDKYKFIKIFAERLFDYSTNVDWIEHYIVHNKGIKKQAKSCFRETIYLPFETIKLPAPIGYAQALTGRFGDWLEPVVYRDNKLGLFCSADIPYREFLQRVDLNFMLPKN